MIAPHRKRYISLTGDAVPELYKLPMKPHGREIVMLMTNRYGYRDLESCWEDNQWLVIDSFNKKVFGSDSSKAIEVVPESIYHTPPMGHSHLATLADQPDEYLFAEAVNEEEYQKWVSYVNNHHKMMLMNEKIYREECFKILTV